MEVHPPEESTLGLAAVHVNQEETAKRDDDLKRVVYLSPKDEIANVITHGVGFLLSIFAAWYFYQRTSDAETGFQITCGLFTASMATVYLFSTLSHWVHEPKLRNRLRAWDQGTIYLLIVGTYSPFIWAAGYRWIFLAIVWAAAGFGFYSKVFATHRINAVSTITYLALGWLPAMPLIPYTPWICFLWMLGGGLCYSSGVVFLKMSSRIRYSHGMWHIMVMFGTLCHAIAIDILITRTT